MSNHRNPVPAWLTASYIENNLQNSYNDFNLKVKDIDIQAGSSEGDNYACQVLRIRVKLANKEETLSIIFKFKPETELTKEFQKEFDIFTTEEKFYDFVQLKINEIERKNPRNPVLSPKCYFVDSEHNSICLEDLKEKGFELNARRETLSLQQAELVVEALASLHASGHHVITGNPDIKNDFKKFLWGSDVSKPLRLLVRNGTSSLEKHMAAYNLPEKYQRKLLSISEEMENGALRVCDFDDTKLNMLCHGDCWINNMMFRFKDGKALDVILLDFQILNFNSFANDLQYFLCSSVDADCILNDLDHLLEKYYLKLKEIAPDIPNLTLERVKKEYLEKNFFGYVIIVIFRAFTMAETPPDLDIIMEEKGLEDSGFANQKYISDLHKLLPFLEKHGLFGDTA